MYPNYRLSRRKELYMIVLAANGVRDTHLLPLLIDTLPLLRFFVRIKKKTEGRKGTKDTRGRGKKERNEFGERERKRVRPSFERRVKIHG